MGRREEKGKGRRGRNRFVGGDGVMIYYFEACVRVGVGDEVELVYVKSREVWKRDCG